MRPREHQLAAEQDGANGTPHALAWNIGCATRMESWCEMSMASGNAKVVQMVFYWLFLKWFIANLTSNGQPLGLEFLRLGLGLPWLDHPARFFPSSRSSAGRGFTRRKCDGSAGTSRARGAKSSSSGPGWSFCGAPSCLTRLHLHHPDSVGDRWFTGGWCRRSCWSRGARLTPTPERGHLRWRTEPSCATEATSVPSGLKIRPRVKPRPPCALGESCA